MLQPGPSTLKPAQECTICRVGPDSVFPRQCRQPIELSVRHMHAVPASRDASPTSAWRSMRLLVLALVALVAVTAVGAQRAGRTLGYIERQNTLNAQLPQLRVVLQDLLSAETGQRGYLLTGRTSYLEPYLEAVQNLDAHVGALVQLQQGDRVAQARLLRVQTLVQFKLADMRETIRLQDRGREASALEVMKSDYGKRAMDELRTIIEQLIAQMSEERDDLARQIAEEALLTRVLMITGTSLLVVFVSLAMWKLSTTLRANALLLQRLETEATHDALTGLPNRRYLGGWLAQNLALATRGGPKVSVFFIDLDGFKKVNDVCGHEAGDKLLKDVGAAFTQTLRQSDMLCRLGGDEFAVVAIDARGDADLKRLGQRLIDAVVALPPVPGLPGHVVSASVGIAMHPLHGETPDALLDAADQAMYAAKQAGKRRVVLAPTPSLSAALPEQALEPA